MAEGSMESLEDFVRAFSAAKTDAEKQKVWADFEKWQRAESERLARIYPSDPPNSECHIAILSGLCLSNGAGFKPGDFTPYFAFGHEQAYVWTHTADEYSSLVIDVPPSPSAPRQVWKTLACCMEIAATFSPACEHVYEFCYYWIYRFNPKTPISKQEFLDTDENIFLLPTVKQGFIQGLHFVADLADLLELLQRDDQFFVAAQHFLESIRSHWFCITCELGADPLMHHPSHEPKTWEAIQLSPKLEVAMVQACRVAEALVGQPGKNDRTLKRWKDRLALDPAGAFERVGRSYVDYSYEMYERRNEAAHSRGKIPFEVVRRSVIDAQCFAWQILRSYFEKNKAELGAAQGQLKFNASLLEREVRDYTTKMTDPRYSAARLKKALDN